jgi:hypothetical protein
VEQPFFSGCKKENRCSTASFTVPRPQFAATLWPTRPERSPAREASSSVRPGIQDALAKENIGLSLELNFAGHAEGELIEAAHSGSQCSCVHAD